MSAMKDLLSNSYIFGANAPFIEGLYESYLDNPQSVPEQWREHFDKMQLLPGPGEGYAPSPHVSTGGRKVTRRSRACSSGFMWLERARAMDRTSFCSRRRR